MKPVVKSLNNVIVVLASGESKEVRNLNLLYVNYFAGQDYESEIKTVRKAFRDC